MSNILDLPTPLKNPILVQAPKSPNHCKEIKVLGRRDPRGPDNSIYIWVDANDQLHIRMWKTDRCYKFKEVIDSAGFVELIAD